MEASQQFIIGDREFTFEESDPIFFRTGPIPSTSYKITSKGCNTCGAAWKEAKDLCGSHCHYCGFSNCKKCFGNKTRIFSDGNQVGISAS